MSWTAPRTWVAGETVTAALLNTHLRDNLLDAFPNTPDAWTIYSPSLTAVTTNPTIGNSTLTGSYMTIGNTVHFRCRLTIGSTFSAGSGAYFLSLPLPASANVVQNDIVGNGTVNDTGRRPLLATQNNSTTFQLTRVVNETTLGSTGGGAAWTAGNILAVSGTYEHA